MKGKLIILSGVPASGKSTWAKRIEKENANCVRISRDEIRYTLLQEDDAYFDKENEVFQIFVKRIKENLEQGKIVLADATHLNRASRYKLIKNVRGKYEYSIVMFLEKPDVCLERNKNRVGRERVPDDAMESMIRNFERITDESYNDMFDHIYEYTEERGLKEVRYEEI